MNLANTGWVFAASNRGVGLVPLNYLALKKPPVAKVAAPPPTEQPETLQTIPEFEEPSTSEVQGVFSDVATNSGYEFGLCDIPEYFQVRTEVTDCNDLFG